VKRLPRSTVLKRLALLTIVSSTLIACSSTSQPQHLSSATQIIREPAPLVVVDNKAVSRNFQLQYGNDKAVEAAFNRYIKTGKAENIITKGFEKFAYSNMNQPIINCIPFQETIITLQPGEKFTSITSGDPQNLSYSAAVSGSATGVETQQILVKPSLSQMSTNLVIATDRRIYNIQIVVGGPKNKVTRNVSFWYPDEMVNNINQKIDKQNDSEMNAEKMAALDLKNANFNYKISGDSPSWKPSRVFDDGKHTWIQMPQGVDNKNLPTILIQSDSGQDMKYNTSYYSPYMIIDGVFGQAKLIAGVGGDQVEVDIYNKNYQQ
jgi:type IV secretion system protein VirB9